LKSTSTNSTKSVCDQQVFNTVFDQQAETLRNYLYYRCGDMQQAEDLVQDAFIKLWNHCKKVVFEKAKSFLYTVSKNAFYNEQAHKKVVLAYEKRSNKSSNIEAPDFLMEEKEFMDKLQRAIDGLTEREREVFLLNRIDKKTYKEIAQLLEISQKAVEKRMHKALIKMRAIIKNV